MSVVIAISGSLRDASYNSGLLRAARERFPDRIEIAGIADIPLYNADVEASDGVPAAVEALKDRIVAADGLLLASPEYNNGIPGVMKNVVDWLSRPPADIPKVFHGKPVAVIGATPGGFGTILAQSAWLPVLRTLRTRPWLDGRLMVSRAGEAFNDHGDLQDEKTTKALHKFVEDFLAFIDGA